MMESYDMSQGTAASGGMTAPPQPGPPVRAPEDSPMLSDPTNRPSEPVTAGMATGPGVGPEALNLDPRSTDARLMRDKWMPVLKPIIEDADTPDSVKMLFRYLRGA